MRFRFGVTAQGFGMAPGRIECLRTSAGELRGDAYVIAGGVDSLALLRPLGIRLPLIAVKGYSATATITALEQAPMTSVMDEATRSRSPAWATACGSPARRKSAPAA